MTCILQNISSLPSELVREISHYNMPYIRYTTYYIKIYWNDMYTNLDIISQPDLILKVAEYLKNISFKNKKSDLLNPHEWMYDDYIKMRPGKMWFWDDSNTNYDE